MPIYREDLDAATACQHCPDCNATTPDVPPGEGDRWIHPTCHIDSPTWARYAGDVLTIQCARCKLDIVSIVIASRESEPDF